MLRPSKTKVANENPRSQCLNFALKLIFYVIRRDAIQWQATCSNSLLFKEI